KPKLAPLSPWEMELAKAAGTWEGTGGGGDEKERCRQWCMIAKASLQAEEKEREKDNRRGEGKLTGGTARHQRLRQLVDAAELNSSFFLVPGLNDKQVLRVQRLVYKVETAFSSLEAARARPPPVASFTQSTTSSSSSRPGQSRRESGGGGGGIGSSGVSSAASSRGGGAAPAGTPAKRPRSRGPGDDEDDDGDLDALVNGGGAGGGRGGGTGGGAKRSRNSSTEAFVRAVRS
ncbi:unnamed protein product, partial [Ectocarpus sp. 6 AP-2014]